LKRLTRISSILIYLQSKRYISAEELTKKFNVSKRTIYRDIATLLEAGIPLGFEQSKGYFIVEGFHLPPVAITEEEANALITAEKFILQQGDTSLISNFQTLLVKIKSTLRFRQKENLDFLESRIGPSMKINSTSSNNLVSIQQAISNKLVLKIKYQSIHKEELTERLIEPLAVYYTEFAWITIAFCHLRNALREFRLDRILMLNQTQDKPVYQQTFSLKEYFENFSQMH